MIFSLIKTFNKDGRLSEFIAFNLFPIIYPHYFCSARLQFTKSCLIPMKHFLLLLSICLFHLSLFAQDAKGCDTIVLKNGTLIIANIDKSNESDIYYTRCGDKDSSPRYVGKSDVKEIRTSQGVTTIHVASPKVATTQEKTATPDTIQLWHVITKDGNDYVGQLLSQDAEKIVLRTPSLGDLKIPKNQIKVLEPIKKTNLVEGHYWYESPHTTRYFFAPNGYGLKAGEGYYQNAWIFLNQVSYGVTNHFSIGAGIIPIFLFGAPALPFWITPKFSVPIVEDKLNLGAGLLYANVIGTDVEANGGVGMTYGVITAGPRDKNITFGLGYGFAGGSWTKYPTLTMSGLFRTSEKFMLITENYLIPTGGDLGNFGVLSAGGRYGGKTIAIDFGLFRPIGQEFGPGFWALPWLGINASFGKRK